ncbi:hypothetical protein D3C86_1938510 [compost metagenome]
MNSLKVFAPKTRAADSILVSICSMKGIITRTTKGTVGTRLASTTPDIWPAKPVW